MTTQIWVKKKKFAMTIRQDLMIRMLRGMKYAYTHHLIHEYMDSTDMNPGLRAKYLSAPG